ncbi:unnamed protein product [Schistosoma curassoni]|uniref:Ovule protein n=1 Tax=Schistosoma curassoni TaxID=6186 RepID=A0A183KYQ2_9TREM|nr:unnamed protein product [Schistosoma curassoni]
MVHLKEYENHVLNSPHSHNMWVESNNKRECDPSLNHQLLIPNFDIIWSSSTGMHNLPPEMLKYQPC